MKGNLSMKNWDMLIKNTKKLSLEDLKKEGDEACAKKEATDAFILAGYEDKRLKSKALIKKGKLLASKKKEDKEKTEQIAASIEVVEG